MTSFLIDGQVAVDAGAITRALTIPEQRQVRYVLITHTHMDHTNTLPFLIENSFGSSDQPVSIFCTKRILAGIRRHLFNNDTWPDFTRIWEVANATEDLAAIITEVSFPNRMQDVADVSLHLTPNTLSAELKKLERDVPVYLYHFKPPYIEELREELAAGELPVPVEELVQDRVYRF